MFGGCGTACLWPCLLANAQREGINRRPVSKLNGRLRVSGALCDPHDQLDKQAVGKPISGIVDLAGKRSGQLRRPPAAADELLEVRIAGRTVFAAFPRNSADRKKGVWKAFE